MRAVAENRRVLERTRQAVWEADDTPGDTWRALGGAGAPMEVREAMGRPESTDFEMSIQGISRRQALAWLDAAIAELPR